MYYGLLLENLNMDTQAKVETQYLHAGLDEEELGSLGMEAWVPNEMALLAMTTK